MAEYDSALPHVNQDLIAFPYILRMGLQNFQSIREYSEFPIAPLTFLYGPNSAGKSAVADALYLTRVLTLERNDSELTALLGRWANKERHNNHPSSHSHSCSSDVVLSYGSVITGQVVEDFSPRGKSDLMAAIGETDCYTTEQFLRKFFFTDLYEDEDIYDLYGPDFRFTLTLNDQDPQDFWRVISLKIDIGGVLFAEAWSGNQQGIAFNRSHPKFYLLNEFFDNDFESLLIDLFSSEGAYRSNNQIIVRPCALEAPFIGGDRPIDWHYGEFTNEWESEDHSGYGRKEKTFKKVDFVLQRLFGALTLAIARAVSYDGVGPIRVIPRGDEAVFDFSPSNVVTYNFTSLYDIQGAQCWIDIARSSVKRFLKKPADDGEHLIDYVNRVISSAQFLDTGYTIDAEISHLLEIKGGSSTAELDLSALCAASKLRVRLFLDQGRGVTVAVEDVGAGISQVIPVITAAKVCRQVHIQQPELHIHPKLQAQMADVFIERVNQGANPFFILESHSEHLILRVLRRIRETSGADIKNRLLSLAKDQVAVLYFDKQGDGSTKIKHLRVSGDGEFIDRWPKGFFTEREAELFDE